MPFDIHASTFLIDGDPSFRVPEFPHRVNSSADSPKSFDTSSPLALSIVLICTRVSAKNCTTRVQTASKGACTYAVFGAGAGAGGCTEAHATAASANGAKDTRRI